MKIILSVFTIIFIILSTTFLIAEKTLQDFILEDIDGNRVKSTELLKKGPIILDFWATWCKPCTKELPELDKLHTKYDTLITVVCISIDKPKSMASAKAIIKSQQFSFVTLFDINKEVQNMLNIKLIPRTFIVNTDNTIVYEHTGYKKGDEVTLEEELNKLLNETSKQSPTSQVILPVDSLKPPPIIPVSFRDSINKITIRDSVNFLINTDNLIGKTPKFVIYDEEPIPIKKVFPEYPEGDLLIPDDKEPEVILQVEVFKDGSVGAVKVLGSLQSGPGGLDELAIQAMKQWKFIPAKNEGQPIAIWFSIPIKFSD